MTDIEETEFVAFDLETTGLHPIACRIVEIGAIRFRGDGEVMDQFQQLVNPQIEIPLEVTRIHGITDRMVADEPVISQVLPQFLSFLGKPSSILLAHNAPFDLGFLSVDLGLQQLSCPEHPVLDTCKLARGRLPVANYRLETIGQHLQLIDTEKHRALDDAVLLMHVFLHLTRERLSVRHSDQLFDLASRLSFDMFATIVEEAPQGYEELWFAMRESTPVSIEYQGGGNPGARRTITPNGAVQMRGRVYLSAYCHRGHCDKTFRLDRITSFHRVSE